MSVSIDSDVFREVLGERYLQEVKWGGARHDDEHSPEDWIDFMRERLDRADEMIGCPEEEWPEEGPDAEYRRKMVQVAALSVAAVESFDRTKGCK